MFVRKTKVIVRLSRLVVAATAAITLLACSKVGARSGQSNELRIAINVDPTQLNPILEQNTNEAFVDGLMFNLLVSQDAQHHQIPDLAAVVPTKANGGISQDGRTLTYHLRHGVKWHDGAPFTSGDVRFTWQAIMNPSNNVISREGYDQVTGVDTPNEYTVVFHLKRIFAPAVETIFGASDTISGILPEHLLAKYPNLNQVPFNTAPVGTGPFKFVRWDRGDQIKLTANSGYFKGAPKLRGVTLPIVLDYNTELLEMQSHQVDAGITFSPTLYRELAGVPGIVRQRVEAPVYAAIYFNTSRPPLNDVRVRRALVLGIDRAGITRRHLYGSAILATADLSPYYSEFDKALLPTPYNPRAAKALLDSAGWRTGHDGIRVRNGKRLSLQLVYGAPSALSSEIGAEVQQMYLSLGVDVQTKAYSAESLYAASETGGILYGGKFDLAFSKTILGADPDNSSLWTCAAVPPAGDNTTRYCSAKMDGLQRLALSTFNRTVRTTAYHQIEALLLRDAPVAFLYYQPLLYAHIGGLRNFTPNGITETWNAQEWNR